MAFQLATVLVIIGLAGKTISQNTQYRNDVLTVSQALDTFALNFLAKTTNEAGKDLNLALAPYTVWSLLGMMSEGARGETEQQLVNALGIADAKDIFKSSYKQIINNITAPADGINILLTNAIFMPDDIKLQSDYEVAARKYFNLEIRQEDFNNKPKTLNNINSFIAKATNNRIPTFLQEGDLNQGKLILASALFFKGAWSQPFNRSLTRRETFYDHRNNPIGEVDLMHHLGAFPCTVVPSISSQVVELPYGQGDSMSMIVILPKKGVTIEDTLNLLAETKIESLLDLLEMAEKEFADDEVHVFLPKFKIKSDLNLNKVLHEMGIKALFNYQQADLLKMFNHFLYVSRLIQQATIEVDEEGTVASAIAGAVYQYKVPPPVFKADRPFAYLIIHKPTKSVIFAGKVSNPNRL